MATRLARGSAVGQTPRKMLLIDFLPMVAGASTALITAFAGHGAVPVWFVLPMLPSRAMSQNLFIDPTPALELAILVGAVLSALACLVPHFGRWKRWIACIFAVAWVVAIVKIGFQISDGPSVVLVSAIPSFGIVVFMVIVFLWRGITNVSQSR